MFKLQSKISFHISEILSILLLNEQVQAQHKRHQAEEQERIAQIEKQQEEMAQDRSDGDSEASTQESSGGRELSQEETEEQA